MMLRFAILSNMDLTFGKAATASSLFVKLRKALTALRVVFAW
jgi:hypothetical protein